VSQLSSLAVRSLRQRLADLGPVLQARVAKGELSLAEAEADQVHYRPDVMAATGCGREPSREQSLTWTRHMPFVTCPACREVAQQQLLAEALDA
jgi:hypothetical protein